MSRPVCTLLHSVFSNAIMFIYINRFVNEVYSSSLHPLHYRYYNALAAGDLDIMRPLYKFYNRSLDMIRARVASQFKDVIHPHPVSGGVWPETMTQFGTFLPSEKGYHCPSIRDAEWTIDWAGNAAVNLHREGSVELILLALDYYEHTEDDAEFALSILPLAIGVTDFVSSYYDINRTSGELKIWPTQALEGYRPGSYPPTDDNCVHNDMPWVAGLTAVIPRLHRAAIVYNARAGGKQQQAGGRLLPPVAPAQLAKWQQLTAILPPLPVTGTNSSTAQFTAAETPYPPHAVLGGSEQPQLYAVHPYRLSSVMHGGPLLQVGINTVGKTPSYGNGWQQGVMQVALLGMGELAADAVLARASTLNADMRFPAYLPDMQDFRPNEVRKLLQC